MEPMISVVIPMFNAEKYIREAVDSVLNQTVDDLEVLVVDDCSTDQSAQAVESIDDARIKLLRHEKNAGPAVARNTAFDAARGKYIACLDADDIFIPNALEILLNYADKADADVVSANGTFVSESEQMPKDLSTLNQVIYDGAPVNIPTRLTKPDDSVQTKMERYIRGAYGFGHCWSKLYRREFLDDNGIRFRENAEDRCFTFECALHARTYLRLPIFINVYRRITESLSRQPSTMKHLEDGVKGMSKFAADFEESMRLIKFFEENPAYKFQIINLQLTAVDTHETMRYYPKGDRIDGDVIAAVDRAAQEAYGDNGAFIAWLFNQYHVLRRRVEELTPRGR